MGEKMVKYFELASQEGGLKAKMKLAKATGILSNDAAGKDDDPALLDKFHAALTDILGKVIPKF